MTSGAEFYDQDQVFEVYGQAQAPGPGSPNHVMEEPAFLRLLGGVEGLRVLDLGCGDAAVGRRLLANGAAGYTGIDASTKMVAAAITNLEGTHGQVKLGTLEEIDEPSGAYDVIISRLAFHYVADIDDLLARCTRSLTQRGRLVITVMHPVITSYDGRNGPGEPRTSWEVDRYFDRGVRVQPWLGSTVIWYHRTIKDYLGALRTAGFALTHLSEAEPSPDRFEGNNIEHARRQRIPLFLILAGQRI